MLIGYARVSTDEQDTALQKQALTTGGAERIFEETASGGRWNRPELQEMLNQLRKGDVVLVWKLDRLSRSLKDLLQILEKIKNAGAQFKSLTESVMDTTTPSGELMMHMIGAFAQFERSIIRERVRAGLLKAKADGRVGGRKTIFTPHQKKEIFKMASEDRTGADIARMFRCHPSTICRLLDKEERPEGYVEAAKAK